MVIEQTQIGAYVPSGQSKTLCPSSEMWVAQYYYGLLQAYDPIKSFLLRRDDLETDTHSLTSIARNWLASRPGFLEPVLRIGIERETHNILSIFGSQIDKTPLLRDLEANPRLTAEKYSLSEVLEIARTMADFLVEHMDIGVRDTVYNGWLDGRHEETLDYLRISNFDPCARR